MSNLSEQVVQINQAALTSVLRLGKISLDSIERLSSFQIESARVALEDVAANAKALTEVKDFQEFANLYTKLAQSAVEKVLNYSRNLYELASETQAQFSAFVEENLAEFNKNAVTAIDRAVKSAPVGADVAAAAVKSTVAATTAAVDSITKAAKQVASFTDASVKAAASATAAAVKTASAAKAS